VDFRDRIYLPALIEVPPRRDLDEYRRYGVPVLDQGSEGACTGFGLAAVANFLLRRRMIAPNVGQVSARMLYEMARRYDEWEGEDYDGSSARGAMKGWHKHGVCADELWSYEPGARGGQLTPERIADAAIRPLGAYYRVDHEDLVSMHAALNEVEILYATGVVHEHWQEPAADGTIRPRTKETKTLGGHAFAVVGYDHRGFWIQNSWGDDWGLDGFALLTYEDWLTSSSDVWVARLGVPVTVGGATESVDDFTDVDQPHVYTFGEMRPHVLVIGDDGELTRSGTYATTPVDVVDMVRIFDEKTQGWQKRRLVLFAHGGLVSASSAVNQAARLRSRFLDNEIYPIFFVWKTDWFSTLTNMLDDLFDRWSAEAPAGGPLDFLLDRTDDMLEAAARGTLLAKQGWAEIKENGQRATTRSNGGARVLADALAPVHAADGFELHLVGHSAGSILLAPLAQYLATGRRISSMRKNGLGLGVASTTLWAPAATVELVEETYLPLLDSGDLDRLTVFALRDDVERDDAAGPYRKSILYLVSNALEERARIPLIRPDGEPLLGMEKFLTKTPALDQQVKKKKLDLVIGPTAANAPVANRSRAKTHVGFSSDTTTHIATVSGILGSTRVEQPMSRSAVQTHEQETRKEAATATS
ncbi:MAG: C1 family peptidase, partial [Acidimicrobiia bacterium]